MNMSNTSRKAMTAIQPAPDMLYLLGESHNHRSQFDRPSSNWAVVSSDIEVMELELSRDNESFTPGRSNPSPILP